MNAVAHYISVFHARCVHGELKALGLHLIGKYRGHVFKHAVNISRSLLKTELSALYPAHLQHVVDEIEKMSACDPYLADIIAERVLISRSAFRKIRIADDGIQRSPYIVRHVGQENGL